jgi:hypothetical protein
MRLGRLFGPADIETLFWCEAGKGAVGDSQRERNRFAPGVCSTAQRRLVLGQMKYQR